MPSQAFDESRRRLLRGRLRAAPQQAALRPPWARADLFTDLCTRCGACVHACPEAILHAGDGGFPEVDFRRGECSFCAACADACPEPLFDRAAGRRPWTHVAAVGPSCLTASRVVCRSCGDACPESAIRFALEPNGAARPSLDALACTGCGACLSACPVGAVTIGAPETSHAA